MTEWTSVCPSVSVTEDKRCPQSTPSRMVKRLTFATALQKQARTASASTARFLISGSRMVHNLDTLSTSRSKKCFRLASRNLLSKARSDSSWCPRSDSNRQPPASKTVTSTSWATRAFCLQGWTRTNNRDLTSSLSLPLDYSEKYLVPTVGFEPTTFPV